MTASRSPAPRIELTREEQIAKFARQLPPYAKLIAARITLSCLKHYNRAPAFREIHSFEYELWASALCAVFETSFHISLSSDKDRYYEYTKFCLKYGYLIEEIIELSFLHITSMIEETMQRGEIPESKQEREALLDKITDDSKNRVHHLILTA